MSRLTSLELHRSHNDQDGIASTLDNLGYITHNTGNHGLAITYYQQSLTLHQELRNTHEVAAVLDRLGHPFLAIGQHHQARAAWEKAAELYQAQHRTASVHYVQQLLRGLDSEAVQPSTGDGR